MRKVLFFSLIILPFCIGKARAQDTKIVFLHHSTDRLIYNDRKVADHPSVACLEDICSTNNVIILKHCYPGADILEDTGAPALNASRKSLENYKMHTAHYVKNSGRFPIMILLYGRWRQGIG